MYASSISDTKNQMHAHGGTMHPKRVNWDDCVRVCEETPACVAVDHVRGVNTCWTHNSDTGCGKLSFCTDCTHYKLQTCGKEAEIRIAAIAVYTIHVYVE